MILAAVFSIFIFTDLSGTKCELDFFVNETYVSGNETSISLEDRLNNDSKQADLRTTLTSTSITFDASTYCRQFKECSTCSQSFSNKCTWCHNYGCTDKESLLCPQSNILRENFENDPCPKIHIEGKEILIPSGVRTNLKVKLHIPDPVILDKDIICQIKLTDRVTHLKGVIMGDTVYCYPVILRTKVNELVDIGTVKLIWGGVTPVSNDIPVTVYKCEAMGLNCESCKMIPIEYGCGWCDSLESCVIGDKCSDDFMRWTINRMMCNDYQKKMFFV